MFIKRWVLGLYVVVGVSAPLLAAPIQVRLVLKEKLEITVPVTVTATPVTGTLEAEKPQPVSGKAEAPGSVTLDLDSRLTWRLRVAAEGLWGPQPLLLGGGEQADLSIDLLPTATLSARIEIDPGQQLPGELAVRLRSSTELLPAPGAFDEILLCPVAERLWNCDVPSGTFDLRLRARTFLSHFFWERELPAGQEVDLGLVKLVPGSAISGWLVTVDASPLAPGTKVIGTPHAVQQGTPREETRHRSLAVEVRVTNRGFFHLQGLRPGAYLLHAEQTGFVPIESVPVVVIEGTEIELLEPLVLARPAELRVNVVPAVDGEGEAWKVSLLAPVAREFEAAERSGSDGAWTARGLTPGQYVLMVADSRGSRVASEEIAVESPITERWVELRFIEVEGKVTLGEEPLQSTLAFGGRSGMTSVKMEADEDGHFSGRLPRSGTWSVDVVSESPSVFRRLGAIEVEPIVGSSRAIVELELPATRLEGDVVDASGNGIQGATVLAAVVPQRPEDPRERPAYTRTAEGGLFSLEGIEAATYRLQAILASPSGQKRQSEPIEVKLREEDPFLAVRLQFGPPRSLTGRVFSRGGGVPGASIRMRPRGGGGGLLIPSAQTGPDGRFEMSPPEGVDQVEVTAMAPGFLLYKEVAALVEGEELTIFVEQEGGGTLAIRSRDPIEVARGHGLPWVVRSDGAVFDVGSLTTWSSLNQGLFGGELLEVPMMPSGAYMVCWPGVHAKLPGPRDPDCIEGYLPAYGRLEIGPGRARQPDHSKVE